MKNYDYVTGAVEWAKSIDEVRQERYWDLLCARAHMAYFDTRKKTIMRNQLHLGFSNNFWPTLSRLLILDDPRLARKIRPRESELDSDEGRNMLLKAYQNITGKAPKINDWRLAKELD